MTWEDGLTVISSPPLPIDLIDMPNGDVLVLPALWPVRLTPEQQRLFGERLLAGAETRETVGGT